MHIEVHFYDATRKAFHLNIMRQTIFFSFETIIGVHAENNRMRLHNSWGVTTGKHINKMGIREFEEVSEETLMDVISRQMAKDGIEMLNKYIKQGIKP